MSYGTNLMDAYYQMGVLIGRILKGANIADLPVTRPTKFALALISALQKYWGSRSRQPFSRSLMSS